MMAHASRATGGRASPESVLVAFAGGAIGIIFGYDLGSVAGALPSIVREFGLSELEAGWVNGVIVSSQIPGALAAGKLNDTLGRRWTMIAIAASYAVVALLQAISPNVVMLDVVRLVLGATIGVSMVSAPLFVAEISPARLRGRFVALYQVATVGGIFITYLVNYFLSFGDHWRIMLGLAAIPAIIVLGCLMVLPESPRWLILNGHLDEAKRVLTRTDPEADLELQIAEIEREACIETGRGLADMVRPAYRRATVFVVCLGVFAQITGINAITYYSPIIFTELGFRAPGQSLALPSIVQFCAVLATIASLSIVDRLGRRITLLSGLAFMAAGALVLSLVFGLGGGSRGAGSWTGFAAVLVFTCAFNGGFGSVVWVYSSEAFPVRLRAIGASVMLVSALLANLVVADAFLWAASALGMAFVFAFFTAMALVALTFIALRAPETSGRSLEEIRTSWQVNG
ncbi:sugar porter family MFS transporter [Pendulispora albinea]|uniref:Sugar porter family MFS transporter n=1 Tax=Pendulispora albinea TaxID=2741071 RepID=A0ABZ2LPI1_9BACT